MKHTALKRVASFVLAVGMLVGLLSACSGTSTGDTAAIHVVELSHATCRSTSGVQVESNEVSAQDGTWLLLSVENRGGTPIVAVAENDPARQVSVEPGQTGTLSQEIGSVPKNHTFKVLSAEPGSEVYVSYTLTQSTSQPDP